MSVQFQIPLADSTNAGLLSPSEKTTIAGSAATAAALAVHTADTANPHVVTKTQVGLGNVDNTSDANKPVSTAQATALALKANLASPALTGTPTAPTAATNTNSTQIATTAFVAAAIANLIASAPGALDTLNELAAALGNDASFASTMTTALAAKAPIESPGLSGIPTAPTAALNTNTTQIATTAFAIAQDALRLALTGGTLSGAVAGPAFQATAATVNAQTGTTYTLQASDNGKIVTLNNASSVSLVVPSGLGASFSCMIAQLGAGQVSLTASGTTINPTAQTKLYGRYAAASLFAYAADTFLFAGNTSA